jgi:eukaryotic-like serine/threonine-protein kinase
MRLLSRTEFADIHLFEEGDKRVLKRYRIRVGDEAHFLRLLGGIYTPKLYGSDGETVTMEFIDGADLGAYLRSIGPGNVEKRLETVRSIAYIYSFFHDNGVLHMDPKPDNILVKKDGTLKVVDFQLSTTVENPVVHLSREGIPYYWYNSRPPESFSREFKPSIRSEIYSLGHLFFFVRTGHFLFEDFAGFTEAEVTREKLREFHEHIDRFKPADDPLSLLIGAMIQRREKERPESMKKVLQALTGIASGARRQRGTG